MELPSHHMINVVFETKAGGRFSIGDYFAYSDTVLEVKEKLAKHTHIPVHSLTLVFNGQTLSDDRDFAHYGIFDGSSVLVLYPGDDGEDHINRQLRMRGQNIYVDDPYFGPYVPYATVMRMPGSGNVGGGAMYNSPLVPQMTSTGHYPGYPSYGPSRFFSNNPIGNIGGGAVNPQQMTSTGHFYDYFPSSTSVFTDKLPRSNVGRGGLNPPPTTSTGRYYDPVFYGGRHINPPQLQKMAPIDPVDIGSYGPSTAVTNKPIGDVGGDAGDLPQPQRMASSGVVKDPYFDEVYIMDELICNVDGTGTMYPPQMNLFPSTVFADASGRAMRPPPRRPKTPTGPSIVPAFNPSTAEKRKGSGGGSAITSSPQQRRKLTFIGDHQRPKANAGSITTHETTASDTPIKMTVMLQARGPSGDEKAVAVEVYMWEKVGSTLRRKLKEVEAEKKMKLVAKDEEYYFKYNDEYPMEEEVAFFQLGFAAGSTITVHICPRNIYKSDARPE